MSCVAGAPLLLALVHGPDSASASASAPPPPPPPPPPGHALTTVVHAYSGPHLQPFFAKAEAADSRGASAADLSLSPPRGMNPPRGRPEIEASDRSKADVSPRCATAPGRRRVAPADCTLALHVLALYLARKAPVFLPP